MQYIKKFTDNLTYTAYVNSDNSVSRMYLCILMEIIR